MALEEIKGYMVGIVLCILVFTGGILVLGEFRDKNPTLSSDKITQFNQTLGKADNVTYAVNEVKDSITSTTSATGGLGWLNALIGSMFNGLQATFQTLSFVDTAATEGAELFGIPTQMVALISLIGILIVGFAIWSAIARI